jgi:hypothetical protein
MKVIVKESGFYGGTWYNAADGAVEMHDRVARQFLPPHGHQLAVAPADEVKPAAKPAATAEKFGKRKAG